MDQQLQQFIDEKRAYIKEKYNDELELLYEQLKPNSFRLMVKLKGYNNSHSWAYMGAITPTVIDLLKQKFDDKAHEIAESKWK